MLHLRSHYKIKQGEQGVALNTCPAANSIIHDHSTFNPQSKLRLRAGVRGLRRQRHNEASFHYKANTRISHNVAGGTRSDLAALSPEGMETLADLGELLHYYATSRSRLLPRNPRGLSSGMA